MKGSAYTEVQPDSASAWIVELAIDCGLSANNGFGISPIPWSEVKSWQDATGNNGYWIAETVRRMSTEYVGEFFAAKHPGRQSPIDDAISIEIKRQSVSQQFKNFVRTKR